MRYTITMGLMIRRLAVPLSALLFLSACASSPEGVTATASPEPGLSSSPKTQPTLAPKRAVEKTVRTVKHILVREDAFFPDGSLMEATVYGFDSLGRLTAVERFNHKRVLQTRVSTVWLDEGRGATSTTFNAAQEIQSVAQKSYDPFGRLVREVLQDSRKDVQMVSDYVWNADGSPASWTSLDRSQNIITVASYRIENSAVKEIIIRDDQGGLIKTVVHTRGQAGELLESRETDADGTAGAAVRYQYRDGRLVREEHFRSGATLVRSVEYDYDQDGAPVTVRTYDRRGQLSETRRREFKNVVEERVVTVYE